MCGCAEATLLSEKLGNEFPVGYQSLTEHKAPCVMLRGDRKRTQLSPRPSGLHVTGRWGCGKEGPLLGLSRISLEVSRVYMNARMEPGFTALQSYPPFAGVPLTLEGQLELQAGLKVRASSAHKAQPNVRAGARGQRHSRLTPTPSPPHLPQLSVKWTKATSHRVLPTSSGPLKAGTVVFLIVHL